MRKLLALLITEVPHLSSPARRAIAVEELRCTAMRSPF